MKTIQDIENRILTLTTSIEVNYPALYASLNENPITIPSQIHPEISIEVMENYLQSLKDILKEYIKTHQKE